MALRTTRDVRLVSPVPRRLQRDRHQVSDVVRIGNAESLCGYLRMFAAKPAQPLTSATPRVG